MYVAVAKDLRTSIDQALAAVNETMTVLEAPASDGSQFDLSIPVPGIEASAATIVTAFRILADQVKPELDKLEELQVPNTALKGLVGIFNQIRADFETARTNLTAAGPINSVVNAATYDASNPSGQVSATKPLRSAFLQLEQAYSQWGSVRQLLRAPRVSEFAVTVRSLSTKVSEIQTELAEIRKARTKIKTHQDGLETLETRMNGIVGEAERLLGEASDDRKTINDAAAEGSERLARIEGILASASELKATVEQHREQYEKFDRTLADRRSELQARSNEAHQLLQTLGSIKSQVEAIVTAANDMLKGATNAGLASTFNSRVQQLKWQVAGARWAFYGSIVFLMICAVPLAIYLLPKEFSAWLTTLVGGAGPEPSTSVAAGAPPPSGTIFLGQVLARAALLVPALWLTRFTSARHDKLFRLMEHYRHKYSIAMSVEGFKQQAPEYQDEIAATTFFELSFNPADSMDRKSPTPRVPKRIMDALLKRLEKTVEDAAKPAKAADGA